MKTTNSLEQIGLSTSEATVYIALLKRGKLGYSAVAKETGINRSSIYAISQSLIKLGLIAEDTTSPVAALIALPPQNLAEMVKRQKAEVEQRQLQAEEVVEKLKTLAEAATYPLPQTILVTEDKLRKYLYESTKRWNAEIKATDGLWWGYQDPSFIKYYHEWITWYWEQPSSDGIETRMLTHESNEEVKVMKAAPTRRHTASLKNVKFTGTQWANGHSIILINTASSKHYLTEIIDPILAANTREIFKKLWEQTVKVKQGKI